MNIAPNTDAPHRAKFFFDVCSLFSGGVTGVLGACDSIKKAKTDESLSETAKQGKLQTARAALHDSLRVLRELNGEKLIDCPSLWLERGMMPPAGGVTFTGLPWPTAIIWQSVYEQISAIRAAFFSHDSLMRKLANSEVDVLAPEVAELLAKVEGHNKALYENLSMPEIADPAACNSGWRGEIVLILRELDELCCALSSAESFVPEDKDSSAVAGMIKQSGALDGRSSEEVEFISTAVSLLGSMSARLLSALAACGENRKIAALSCLPLIHVQNKQHPIFCQAVDLPISETMTILTPWQEHDIQQALRRPAEVFGARMIVWLASCDPTRGGNFIEPLEPLEVLPYLVLRWTGRPAVLRLASEFTSAIMYAARILSRSVIERDGVK